MREAAHVVGAEADGLEQVDHALLALAAVAGQAVDGERLADDAADGVARVERGERVLEDDLHVAPHVAQLLARRVGDVASLEPDLARAGLDQPQDAAPGGRLAAAALADEAERLAAPDLEADAVDRVHRADLPPEHPAMDRELLRQAADGEEGFGHLGISLSRWRA